MDQGLYRPNPSLASILGRPARSVQHHPYPQSRGRIGFLAGASPRFRILFFIAITLLALGLILYYLYQATEAEGFQAACLSLIFAGAAGNLIDRVRFGEVVDFLDVHWGVHHWPAFNVADAAISAGAILLVLALIREGRAKA